MKIESLQRQAVRSNQQINRVTALSNRELRNVVGGADQPFMIEFFCRDDFGDLECIIYI